MKLRPSPANTPEVTPLNSGYRHLIDSEDTIQEGNEALQDNGEWKALTVASEEGRYIIGRTYYCDIYVPVRRRILSAS